MCVSVCVCEEDVHEKRKRNENEAITLLSSDHAYDDNDCLVLCCLVLSCVVLSCLVLSCLVLSCLVLSCLVLSCLHNISFLSFYNPPTLFLSLLFLPLFFPFIILVLCGEYLHCCAADGYL